MPELAEVRVMADQINKLREVQFHKVERSDISKIETDLSCFPSLFKLDATARGKELAVRFRPRLPWNQLADTLMFSMGMSGFWLTTLESELHNYPHLHLQFYGEQGVVLGLHDQRRFAKYRWGEFDPNRSPCPYSQKDDFFKWVHEYSTTKYFQKTAICSLLLDQGYFNGIGNYLRAEILYRADISPWQTGAELVAKPDDFTKLLQLCHSVPGEAYGLAGGVVAAPYITELSAAQWIKCYQQPKMSSWKDDNGRVFWYDPKWD